MIYQQSVKANLQTLRARGKNWWVRTRSPPSWPRTLYLSQTKEEVCNEDKEGVAFLWSGGDKNIHSGKPWQSVQLGWPVEWETLKLIVYLWRVVHDYYSMFGKNLRCCSWVSCYFGLWAHTPLIARSSQPDRCVQRTTRWTVNQRSECQL